MTSSQWKLTYDPAGAATVLVDFDTMMESDELEPQLDKRVEVIDLVDAPAPFLRVGKNAVVNFSVRVITEAASDADARAAMLDGLIDAQEASKKPLLIEVSGIEDRYWKFFNATIKSQKPRRLLNYTAPANVTQHDLVATGLVRRDKVTRFLAVGDSLTETAFRWKYELFLGVGFQAVYHSARYEASNLVLITVAHVNAGAGQALGIAITGNAVVVTLATDGAGTVTSTVADVVAYCNTHAGYLALGLWARTLGSTHLAQAASAKYLSPSTASTADGYIAWLQLLSAGRMEPVRFNPTTYPNLLAGSWTFGKSGLTTGSIITYLLPDVLLLGAGKLIIEMSGTNDILMSVAQVTTVANRCAMWDAMQAAGCTVVACEVMPLIESAPLVAAGDNADIVALNAALEIEAAARGVRWIKWPATLFDGLEAEATLWEVDGIHDNPAGCRIGAAHVLAEIEDLITDFPFEFPAADATDWITANPYMTGGTTIATGWSTPTAYPSATVTPSLITKAGRQWQRLTCTQSGAEYKLAVFNLSGQAVTAGSRVRILAKLDVGAGFKNVRVVMTFNGPGGTLAAMEGIDDGVNMTSGDYTVTLPAHSGPWLSPPELVPTGATSATLSVWMFGAGTVDIAICGVVEV